MVVRQSTDQPDTVLACGEILDTVENDQVVVPLRAVEGSNYTGVGFTGSGQRRVRGVPAGRHNASGTADADGHAAADGDTDPDEHAGSDGDADPGADEHTTADEYPGPTDEHPGAGDRGFHGSRDRSGN